MPMSIDIGFFVLGKRRRRSRCAVDLRYGDLKQRLQAAFPDLEFPEEMPERYNIAPTDPVAVAPNDGARAVQFYRWGLVPGWSDGPSSRYTMINARSETAAEKPAFRTAYRHRRCLVLADGFYEWTKRAGDRRKTPMYVRLASDAPLAFAGLWEVWQPQGQADAQPLYSCTILTTDANDLIASVHPRMPRDPLAGKLRALDRAGGGAPPRT